MGALASFFTGNGYSIPGKVDGIAKGGTHTYDASGHAQRPIMDDEMRLLQS